MLETHEKIYIFKAWAGGVELYRWYRWGQFFSDVRLKKVFFVLILCYGGEYLTLTTYYKNIKYSGGQCKQVFKKGNNF